MRSSKQTSVFDAYAAMVGLEFGQKAANKTNGKKTPKASANGPALH